VSRSTLRALRAGLAAVALLVLGGGCTNHVQPHFMLPALQMGEPTFQATLVAYTGAAVVPGNRVDVLLNGEEIFPAKLTAIRAARRTITYAQYVFEEGAHAAETAQALADR
jgi:cardiolipin synthase